MLYRRFLCKVFYIVMNEIVTLLLKNLIRQSYKDNHIFKSKIMILFPLIHLHHH